MIATDDGAVKIGMTHRDRLDTRLTQLQLFNHHELTLIRTIDDAHPVMEKWLMNYFKRKGLHIRKSWFKFDEEMLTIELPGTPSKLVANPSDLGF